MGELVKILTVLSEGGGLDFYGRQVDGKCSFRMTMDDATPQLLLGEDPSHSESEWFGSLRKCLSACVYPWNKFHPVHVHPDFASELYKLKLAKDKKDGGYEYVTEKWIEKCGIASKE